MISACFNPEAPPQIGAWVRINAGQFKDYTGKITKLDAKRRAVYFTITVIDRSVELSLDYETAAKTLDMESSNEPSVAPNSVGIT